MTDKEYLRTEFRNSPKLQRDYESEDIYVAYATGDEDGLIRILKRRQKRQKS